MLASSGREWVPELGSGIITNACVQLYVFMTTVYDGIAQRNCMAVKSQNILV